MISSMEQTGIREKILATLSELEIELSAKVDLSSLDLMLLALRLEKTFSIKFEIDEITSSNFGNVDVVVATVGKKLNR